MSLITARPYSRAIEERSTTNDLSNIMPGTKISDMNGAFPSIPIGYDYEDYTYDPDEIADTARTEASSAHDYKYENGRRYHAYREGSYPMPNDELNTEHERIAHAMFGLLLKDRLYLAPIEEPKNVIDLGTGIGLWAFDMAERYEDTKILGLDLTPPPQSLFPNLQFQVDDIRAEWMPDDGYDLVHIRLLFGAIQDWPSLYSKVYENLSPGGYVQHLEIEIKPRCDDNTLPSPNIFQTWANLASRLSASGRHFTVTSQMKSSLAAVGFTDIVETRYKLPLGPWSDDPVYKQLGKYFEMFWRTGCQGWLMQSFVKELGWSPEQVNATVKEACGVIDGRRCHVYYDAVIVVARKGV